MKIVFDAYWWVAGPPSLRHVLRETILGWHEMYPEDDLTLVVRSRALAAARAELPPEIGLVPTRVWPQALSAFWSCGVAGKKRDADVVLTQNYAAHGPALVAVYLHDVLFRTDPAWFTRAERLYFGLMPLLGRRADLVMTSSRAEADRIEANTAIRNVRPVGIGMSTELAEAPPLTEAPCALVPGRFLLTVGRLNVRKNLVRTIEAALASGWARPDHPLVIVGDANGKTDDQVGHLTAQIEDGSVRFLGFVNDAELRWLYENTSLFLFLSLGEGFGMPPVEAVHFGARLVVSDLEVFREILPATVRRVPPEDVDAIRQAIEDEMATAQPGASAPRRHVVAERQYSWEKTLHAMRRAIIDAAAARGRTLR